MAWTQTQLEALERAIATGSRRLEYGSGDTKRVQEFHSLDEMMKLRDQIRTELGLAPPRRSVAVVYGS